MSSFQHILNHYFAGANTTFFGSRIDSKPEILYTADMQANRDRQLNRQQLKDWLPLKNPNTGHQSSKGPSIGTPQHASTHSSRRPERVALHQPITQHDSVNFRVLIQIDNSSTLAVTSTESFDRHHTGLRTTNHIFFHFFSSMARTTPANWHG